MFSEFLNSIRRAGSYTKGKTAAAFCLITLLTATAAQPATGAIVVDGNVRAAEYAGANVYDVTLRIENYGVVTDPAGKAKLFLKDSDTSLHVGFIAPLIVNDNTFAPRDSSPHNRSAGWTDIGKVHELEQLSNSDKWQVITADGGSWDLNYADDTYSGAVDVFDLPGLSIGGFESSLGWNHDHMSGDAYDFRTYFDAASSPAMRPDNYDFVDDSGNPIDWIPEIMYEFELVKSPGSTFGAQDFIDDIFLSTISQTQKKTDGPIRTSLEAGSVFHMSPSMLGKNKVYIEEVIIVETPPDAPATVPEPSAFVVWSLLATAFVGGVCWRRKRVNIAPRNAGP